MSSIPLYPVDSAQAMHNTDGFIPTITPMLACNKKSLPAIIVVPGGGYTHKAPHEGIPIGEWLNSIGISAFILDYSVAPRRHPSPALDARRAVRYIRAHAEQFYVDNTRIGMLGFSAGGHLVATVATTFEQHFGDLNDDIGRENCRPDCCILCYPVISFDIHCHQGSINNLLGPNADNDTCRALSAYRNVAINTPPTFLWHTADDNRVPVENSLLLAGALRAKSVPFELHVFPQGAHGLGLAKGFAQVELWPLLCERWLRSIGF